MMESVATVSERHAFLLGSASRFVTGHDFQSCQKSRNMDVGFSP